jgi:hypothetical protein
MNAETLRLMLTGYLVAMFVLAFVYLRRRPLTWVQFAAVRPPHPRAGTVPRHPGATGESSHTRRHCPRSSKEMKYLNLKIIVVTLSGPHLRCGQVSEGSQIT